MNGNLNVMGTVLGEICDSNFGESPKRMKSCPKPLGEGTCRVEAANEAKVSSKMCNVTQCKSGGKFSTLKLAAMLVLVILLVTDVNGERNPNRARKRR